MIKALVAIGAIGFAGFTIGGTKAYVDSKAGPGTFNDAVDYGTGSAAESYGEVFRVPGKVIEAAKPALNDLRSQADGVLGAGAPQARSDVVDPSEQGGQP